MASFPGKLSAGDPAANAVAVTPSDLTSLGNNTRGLYVGVGGDVSVVMADEVGNTVVFVGVQSGTFMPIQVSRVNSTGTTATDIIALW